MAEWHLRGDTRLQPDTNDPQFKNTAAGHVLAVREPSPPYASRHHSAGACKQDGEVTGLAKLSRNQIKFP